MEATLFGRRTLVNALVAAAVAAVLASPGGVAPPAPTNPGQPFEQLQTNLNGIQADVDLLQIEVGILRTDVDDVQAKLVVVQESLDVLQGTLDGVDAQLDALDLQIDAMDLQLDGIDAQLDVIQSLATRLNLATGVDTAYCATGGSQCGIGGSGHTFEIASPANHNPVRVVVLPLLNGVPVVGLGDADIVFTNVFTPASAAAAVEYNPDDCGSCFQAQNGVYAFYVHPPGTDALWFAGTYFATITVVTPGGVSSTTLVEWVIAEDAPEGGGASSASMPLPGNGDGSGLALP